jgi:hypothetical protein
MGTWKSCEESGNHICCMTGTSIAKPTRCRGLSGNARARSCKMWVDAQQGRELTMVDSGAQNVALVDHSISSWLWEVVVARQEMNRYMWCRLGAKCRYSCPSEPGVWLISKLQIPIHLWSPEPSCVQCARSEGCVSFAVLMNPSHHSEPQKCNILYTGELKIHGLSSKAERKLFKV